MFEKTSSSPQMLICIQLGQWWVFMQ
jgi:hypothetical protein